MIEDLKRTVSQRLTQSEGLWLFLDYDGTLAEFAPTPDEVYPDAELISLLGRLVKKHRVRITIISGRRLEHIKKLLPLTGILLAGTYGIELRMFGGEEFQQLIYDDVRPAIEMLKPRWENLISGLSGFFLEDKGWSLAIHARFASEADAAQVLAEAYRVASEMFPAGNYRILKGDRFLEVGPLIADKGQTVAYVLERFPWPNALLVYIGDDDKDEEAFKVILAQGGIPVVVSAEARPTQASFRLASPQEVRSWLAQLDLEQNFADTKPR